METVELSVDGMTCGSCVQAATRALTRVPGVKSVDVRLQDGAASVTGEGLASQAQALVGALAEAGYPARVATGVAAPKSRTGAGGCGSGGGGCGCAR